MVLLKLLDKIKQICSLSAYGLFYNPKYYRYYFPYNHLKLLFFKAAAAVI